MNNVVGADAVCKKKAEEQELLTAKVNADVAIVLPVDVEPDAQFELQYDAISETINNYIERYTIDARVEKVEYNLSSPELSDKDATNNLKESLTGTTDEITTSKGTIHIENDAIKDNKVTLTFKLSVEENVYLDESDENPSDEINCRQVAKTSSQNPVPQNNVSSIVNSKRNGDLIIQSAEPKLYWQSAPKAELYWQNAPSNISKEAKSKIEISDKVKDNVVDYSNKMRDDLTVILIGHTQTSEDGFTCMLTNGRKLNKICLESKMTTVLLAHVNDNGEYVFDTKAKHSTAKTPRGAFDVDEIPNDITLVIDALKDF